MPPTRSYRFVVLAALVAAFGCGGAADNDNGVVPTPISIAISPSSNSVTVGGSVQLFATVTGTTNTNVVWSTNNSSVATVSSSGVVTGVSAGQATISALSLGDPSKSASTSIIVTPASSGTAVPLVSGVPATGLSGAEDSQRIFKITVPAGTPRLDVSTAGGTGDVDLYLRAGSPPSATAAPACFSEEDSTAESCSIVNPQAGDWYVLLVGFAPYSGVSLTASVSNGTSNPTGIAVTVNPATATLAVGATQDLTATVTGTTNTLVNWTSSDGTVARVATTGVITGVSQGSATITATSIADPSKRGTMTVTVTPATPASGLTVKLAAPSIQEFQNNLLPPLQTVTITRPAGTTNAVRLSIVSPHTGITARFSDDVIRVGQTSMRMGIIVTQDVPMGTYQIPVVAEMDGAVSATATLTLTLKPSTYKGDFFNIKHRILRNDTGCQYDATLSGYISFAYPTTVRPSTATMTVQLNISSVPVQATVGIYNCNASTGSFSGSTTVTSNYPSMNGTVVVSGGGNYTFIYNTSSAMTQEGALTAGKVDLSYDGGSTRTTVGAPPAFSGNMPLLRVGQDITATLP
jgi:uncharacterized protein YjdB